MDWSRSCGTTEFAQLAADWGEDLSVAARLRSHALVPRTEWPCKAPTQRDAVDCRPLPHGGTPSRRGQANRAKHPRRRGGHLSGGI